ncbi:MAG: hypothetical protein D6B28_01105 [Gammaproteobacteria bacterium]|nr:MAG: hypothetical protein D6B28_01105 [Gammaproteobacteria bacterium]
MRSGMILLMMAFVMGCNQEKVEVDDRPKPPKSEQQRRFAEGEIIVRFEDGITEAQVLHKLKIHGASIKRRLGGSQQYLIKLPFGHTVGSALPLYNGLIGVKWAEPNYIMRVPEQPENPGAVKVRPIKIRKVK